MVFRDLEAKFYWSKPVMGDEGTMGPIAISDHMREVLTERVCQLQTSLALVKRFQ